MDPRLLPHPIRPAASRFARFPLVVLLALAAVACAPQARQAVAADRVPGAARVPLTPDEAYPELFRAVQQRWLFDDQKRFVDARPLRNPARIRADYLAQRERAGFDLARFVAENFALPEPAGTADIDTPDDLRAHIDALWPLLTRHTPQAPPYSSLLPLPQPYVVPGGRFREMYYWDSYFTMLGLVESGQTRLSRQMLDDFAHLIDTYGHIPNGTRTYYLSRSQPPFFSHMVELEARTGGKDAYRRYLPQLKREYAFWMDGAEGLAPGTAARRVVRLPDGSLLNRYWDDRDAPRPESYMQDRETAAEARGRPAAEVYRDLRAGAESGWDYSSRWLGDRKTLSTIRTTAIVPVDLNSLMHHLETTIAVACEQAMQPDCTQDFRARADARRAAIETHLWNGAGHYADYDWQAGRISGQVTAAALYPLFTGVASPERARRTARAVETRLLAPGGLVTTAVDTGQQWDAPNVWAPLQWIAVDGLRRYGEAGLAEEIGRRFLAQVQALFDKEHKLVEKYDATPGQGGGGGEYPLQDGFGWTNGVTLKLMALYPPEAPTADAGSEEAAATTP